MKTTRTTASLAAVIALGGGMIVLATTSRAQSPEDRKSAAAMEKRITDLEKQVTELRTEITQVREAKQAPVTYQIVPTTPANPQPRQRVSPGRGPDYYFNGQPVYRILIDGQKPASRR